MNSYKLFAVAASLIFLSGWEISALAQQYDSLMWVPDAAVHAVVKNGNNIYLGGDFDYVGKSTGYAVPLDTATALPAMAHFPKIDGPVYAIAPDYNGGWYIGGNFSLVGGVNRSNFAQIKSDGTVLPLELDPDGPVYAIETYPYPYGQPYVFIGGDFLNIGGITAPKIAQLNATTKTIMPNWNPDFDGPVYAIKKVGEYVYVGGTFTSIDHIPDRYLAKISVSRTYSVDYSNPNPPSGPVYALFYNYLNNKLFAGGVFTYMGSLARNHIAEIDPNTDLVTSWNPNLNGNVRAIGGISPPVPSSTSSGSGGGGREISPDIAAVSNTIYVGGEFTYINLSPAKGFAELSITSPTVVTASTSTVNCDGTVWSIYADKKNNKIYIGGKFKNAGGAPRYNLACVDTNGNATSWQASIGSKVRALCPTGNKIYVGAESPCMFGREAHHIAFVDATTGTMSNWDPYVTGDVSSMIVSNNILYIGGAFDSIQGVYRKNMGAIDLTNNTVTPFDPQNDGIIRTMCKSGNKLYVGGYFNNTGGQARTNIACIDVNSSQANQWDPGANGTVNSIAVNNGRIYCAGYFTFIGGFTSPHIAELDTVIGFMSNSWDPVPNDGIYSLVAANNQLVVGGWFTSVDGIGRNNFCELGLNTPTLSSFDPAPDGVVRSLGLSGNYVFAGGDFSVFGGQPRKCFAAYDITSGQIQALTIRFNAAPLSFFMDGQELYAGGEFTSAQFDVHAFFIKIHSHYLLGTNDVSASNMTLNVYPDPTSGIFTLEGTLNGAGKDLHISVYNNIGQKIIEEKENNSNLFFRKNFDLTSMDAGIYFIRVSDGINNYNSKIIKIN